MIQALSTALGGLNSSMAAVDAAAGNIANFATPGYRSSQVVQGASASGASFPITLPSTASGPLQQTGVSTDLALSGPGYFRVQSGLGGGTVSTTRNGSFVQDGQGYLRSADGGYVLGQDGPLQAPPGSSFSVSRDGAVSATAASGAATSVGTLSLAAFPGGEASGAPGGNGLGTVSSGTLEQSNVDMVDQMVGLIVGKNSFEANAKVVHVTDEMMKKAYEL